MRICSILIGQEMQYIQGHFHTQMFTGMLAADKQYLGFLFVIYAVISFLFVQHTVAGWSSIVAVIAILGAAQLLVLGIIGEYVGRILRETRKRPSYIVAETEAERAEAARPAP